jgi:glycosyltransferase involved in cell wall biosynthesis
MKIVSICGMSEDKVRASLLPLVAIESIETIHLVRRYHLNMQKVESHSPPKLIRWSLLLSEIYRLLALFFVCIQHKPTLIYAIYFVPHGVYAAIVGKWLHIPVVQEIIGTDRPLVNKSRFYKRLLSQAARIGVRGGSSLYQLSTLGIPKEKFFVSVAVNAIDFGLFKPDQTPKVFDCIYVGRIDQNKQINLLIDSFSEFTKEKNAFKFLVVGDGPMRETLEEKVANLGLREKIIFTGKKAYAEIPKFLNESRVFVMASAFEGLPVAMIEALSCGLPVIVPNIGDITDIAVHGYNAFVVDNVVKEAYVDAFSTILTQPGLYDQLAQGALASRKAFEKEFSVEKSKESWENIIQEINR